MRPVVGKGLICQRFLMLSAAGSAVKVSDHKLIMVRCNKYFSQTLDLRFYALII